MLEVAPATHVAESLKTAVLGPFLTILKGICRPSIGSAFADFQIEGPFRVPATGR